MRVGRVGVVFSLSIVATIAFCNWGCQSMLTGHKRASDYWLSEIAWMNAHSNGWLTKQAKVW